MRCLFCKQDSSNTKSIEHIVPESLGNKKFILPIGYVCDKCNNYFAREVEKPFMQLNEIRLLRFQQAIPNKKKRIPIVEGILNERYEVKMERVIKNDEIYNGMQIPPELFSKIQNNDIKNMEVKLPAFTDNNIIKSNKVISRFIAKVALEALAEKLKHRDERLEYLINDSQYDLIRRHAREGTTPDWPCNIRRIYKMNKSWEYNDGEIGQVIYECDFLFVTEDDKIVYSEDAICAELYFIIILWGMEFAINIGGPELEGYKGWLKRHNEISPLYYDKNSDIFK